MDKGLLVLVALFGFCVGNFVESLMQDSAKLECHNYTTKNAVWHGYSAKMNDEHRCFWVEQAYPWRVRQGRVD